MTSATVHGTSSRLRSAATTVCRQIGMKRHAARRVSWAAVACWLGLVLSATVTEAALVLGSVFNPVEFTAIDAGGGLNLTAGDSLTFDTNTLQVSGSIGGAAVSYGGAAASSQGGGVQMAVFTFSSINIGAGATVNVTGDRGLVVGSQSNFYLGSTIGGLAGQAGVVGSLSPSGGTGGVGAEGGTRGVSYLSNPPGANGGDGGNARVAANGDNGVGYGAGQGSPTDQRAGGGGAYGGAGGAAPNNGGVAGAVYGNAMLTELYGGSGGGGARHVNGNVYPYGGGGGGGTLELVATDMLTIDTTLSVTGGAGGGSTATSRIGGGGGSGGGVILAASQIHVAGSGFIDVSGGAGGAGDSADLNRHGGGGGGGRIALYADLITGVSDPTTAMNLSGGAKTGNAIAGAAGTYYLGGNVHAPFVQVDFNDMTAGNVNGQMGKMGLSGTWTTPVNASQPSYHIAAVAGDLVAPASTSFALAQSGTAQSLQGIGNDSSVGKASRTLATPLTDTAWFSFLLEPSNGGRGGIDLNSGRIIAVGSSFNTYLGGHDTSGGSVFTNYGTTYLVLGRLDIDAGTSGEDHLRLWVNPDVTLGPDGLGTPTHQDLVTNWLSTSVTTLGVETYAGTAGGATPRIDLITLSSSPTAYFDVTGVPEPSALLLLAVAGAMLCLRRRRR